MEPLEIFRLEVEGVFDITGRGTAVLGPLLGGDLRVGDVVCIESRNDLRSPVVAIDCAPRAPKTLEDGKTRVGLVVPAFSQDDLKPGDVLVAATSS
jgi:translation elongation factor EF-Tu-like GTPase